MMMNHARAGRSVITLAIVASVPAFACQQLARGGAIAGPKEDEQLRAQLVLEATEAYSLENPSGPVAHDVLDVGTKGKVRNIQVVSFAMKRGLTTPETHTFVAAFFSSKNYDRLGLTRGMNYVLKLTNASGTAYVIVPDKEHAKMYFWPVSQVSDTENGTPPHVIRKQTGTETTNSGTAIDYVVGGCIECDAGHCGATDVGAQFTAAMAATWNLKLDQH